MSGLDSGKPSERAMRRRRYSGPPMASEAGTAGLRARLARNAATPPRPCGVFGITIPTDAETSLDFIGPLNPHVGRYVTNRHT